MAACTSSDTPEVRPALTPEATATSEVPAVATSTTPRPPVPRLGAWIVDAVSGEITKLYELDDPPEQRLPPPSITRTGVVWLTGADGVARRYEPSLGLNTTVDGAVVVESSDAATRVILDAGGTLSVERDGERTVRSEAALSPVLSPDGQRVAYFEERDDELFDLRVASIEEPPTSLATGVQLCECDDPARLRWSLSGAFLAFRSFGSPDEERPEDRGGYVVRADGAEPAVRVTDRPRDVLGWLTGEAHTLVLQVVAEPRLFDPTVGESRALMRAGLLPARGTARLTHDAGQVQIWTADGGTQLVDPASGEELERWMLRGDAALTPLGPSLTLDGPGFSLIPVAGCWGVWIEHPVLPEGECVDGAERAQWSPDGSTLALLSAAQPFDRWLEFWTFDDQTVRVLVPRSVTRVTWSAGGRYVLVAWGYDE